MKELKKNGQISPIQSGKMKKERKYSSEQLLGLIYVQAMAHFSCLIGLVYHPRRKCNQ
jgi:hypothetical protein